VSNKRICYASLRLKHVMHAWGTWVIHTLCFEGQRDKYTDPGGDGGRALVAITRLSAPVASDYVNPVNYILAWRVA
jgi:hypothetical protein